MSILSRLQKAKEFWFLLVVSFVFFLLRLPSLFEPYWYGDEGIYEVIGLAIRNGRLLYRDIWDNKPPLLYLLYASVSSDQFLVRTISLIFSLFSVIVFFLLLKKLFPLSKKTLFLTTSLFAFLLAIPLLEGNIANAENFMMPLTLLAGLIIYKVATDKQNSEFPARNASPARQCQSLAGGQSDAGGSILNSKLLLLAGFFLSLAFLFKIVAIFDFSAFFLFLLIISYKNLKTIPIQFKNLLPLIIGFSLPMILVALFFVFNGIFSDFFQASFKQNVGYVGYGNKFIIPQGLLLFKLLLLFLFSTFVFIKRKKIKISSIFISIWFSFSLFNAFFSQRPYTHYVLVVFPSLMLFFDFVLSSIQTQRKAKIYTTLIFFLTLILLTKNFNFYQKTINFYPNFIAFLIGKKDVVAYRSFFDRNTPRDYQIADYINIHSNSKARNGLFVWGDNPQLYVLTNKLPPGRFTVAYHIKADKTYFTETEKAILKAKPEFIVVTSPNNPIPFDIGAYKFKIVIQNSLIYERIF